MGRPRTVRHHRNPADHLTFGVGIHACVGQALAKLEAQALLTALLARVRRFEIGKPEFVVNNTLHGLSKLSCRSRGRPSRAGSRRPGCGRGRPSGRPAPQPGCP
ncbi:cytochrome P450 [Streptomyces iakyrus]|uniref:cytochrome P450 n=1 Tax=Streptomyces iakyrus TaxID=68219 RepID=UPI003D8A81B7